MRNEEMTGRQEVQTIPERIIAIDQSTSSTKALLFDEECRLLARANVDHHQYYPQTGWVEHDAEEIYDNMVEAIRRLMEDGKATGRRDSGNGCKREDVWLRGTGIYIEGWWFRDVW